MADGLVEMVVESVRVHMLSSQHVVILKEADQERYLPIWIGAVEALVGPGTGVQREVARGGQGFLRAGIGRVRRHGGEIRIGTSPLGGIQKSGRGK